MKKIVWIMMGWLAVASYGAEWRPSNALLRAVRQIESNNGQDMVGDHGRSLGAFQLSEAAWVDVSFWRKARALKVYPYREYAMHAYINQTYAADYLAMIHGELLRKLRRAPTAGEIYAAYNMGLANFAECKYTLAKVNPVTQKKCRQIHALIAQNG